MMRSEWEDSGSSCAFALDRQERQPEIRTFPKHRSGSWDNPRQIFKVQLLAVGGGDAQSLWLQSRSSIMKLTRG